MSILNFDDGKKPKRNSNNLSSRKRFKAILGVGAIVLSISLGSTLAANINLNAGVPVEFGQGVATTMACDDSVFITPNSEFVNDAINPGFLFTSFTVSEISEQCYGKVFTIKAYKNGLSGPLDLYRTQGIADPFNEVQILNTSGSFSFVGAGLQPDDISSPNNASFTVTLYTGDLPVSTALASAQEVDRMTIESRDATDDDLAPGPGPDPDPGPDPGPGGPQTRSIQWVDDCPPVYCVPSSGGQQTFIEGEQVTDYASDPSASGYTFTGWTSVTDSGGDLTFTANWMQDFYDPGGGYGGPNCENNFEDPICNQN
jgi:hypothetical protein